MGEFLKYGVWIRVWNRAKKSVDADKTDLQGREGGDLASWLTQTHTVGDTYKQSSIEKIFKENFNWCVTTNLGENTILS